MDRLSPDLLRRAVSFAWVAVIVVALGLSNYSLFTVGRHYGLPVYLAGFLSVPFDGAALVCADIALKYAREHGANGAGPRAAVFILAGLSAWLNSEHAALIRAPLAAHVMYAVPPVVALYLFEAHTRYERRDALKAADRLSEPRPVLGGFIWTRHPLEAHKAMQLISAQRLSARVAIENERETQRVRLAVTPAALKRASTQADAIRVAFRELGDTATAADICDWLSERGWDVEPSQVRVVRSRSADQDRNTAVSPPVPAASLPFQPVSPAELNGAAS